MLQTKHHCHKPFELHKFISCVVPGPLQWFFYFGEEIVIAWTHIGWAPRMFQNLSLPASQKVRDSSSGMTPCIFMKNYGVLYHQESFSSKRWTKVVLQERAVVGSIYPLLWCSITPSMSHHNDHHLHNTLCRVRRTGMLPFIWLAFQVWFVWESPSFVHSDDPSMKVIPFLLVPVQQCLWDCIAVPLLHLGNIFVNMVLVLSHYPYNDSLRPRHCSRLS